MNVVSPRNTMTTHRYILFNKTPEQLRRLGARGGRAYGRNQRARRALMPPPPQTVRLFTVPRETTAEALVALDAQFPWLRFAEKRISHATSFCPDACCASGWRCP